MFIYTIGDVISAVVVGVLLVAFLAVFVISRIFRVIDYVKGRLDR